MITTQEHSLESKSLWYRYKTQVWPETGDPSPQSEQAVTIHNIMRVMRSIRFNGLTYLSVPITSGTYLYNLKKDRPLMDFDKQMEAAILHNYRVGHTQYKGLCELIPESPILFPADMVPSLQKWEQEHFQALWLNIIAELCNKVYMGDGWQYSNGAVEEFVHVMQLRLGIPIHKGLIFFNTKESEEDTRLRMKRIEVYDLKTREEGELSIEQGIEKIRSAISWIEKQGFEAPKLRNSLELLYWTKEMLDEGFYQ